MYEVGLRVRFHATHSLRGDFGPAQQLHSHDYVLDVTVRGESLTDQGVLIDVVRLQSAVQHQIDRLDGACLDELPELASINTTVEGLSAHLHRQIGAGLSTDIPISLNVRVWETPDVWGGYSAPVP